MKLRHNHTKALGRSSFKDESIFVIYYVNILRLHVILNEKKVYDMKDYTIRFKDCSIYYEMHENKTKPTLVFLHGYTSSLNVFESIIVTFKKDYQLLLIDLPGHGKSGVSSAVGFKDMPEIMKSILDYQEISSAYFIGVDVGSLVAQGFGHIYPEHVNALVSVGSYSIYHDSCKKVSNEHFLTNASLSLKWLFAFKKYLSHFANIAAITESGLTKFKTSQSHFKRSGLKSFKGLNRFYKWDKPTKHYPIYVVCGEFEEEVIKDASIQFEQRVPNALLEGFNKSKRVVFLDQPRLFIEHVQTFLKSHLK